MFKFIQTIRSKGSNKIVSALTGVCTFTSFYYLPYQDIIQDIGYDIKKKRDKDNKIDYAFFYSYQSIFT